MIFGNRGTFAIETEITEPYENPSLRALGFFVIYLGNLRYGVRSADASLLAVSYDGIVERLSDRGRHVAPFSDYSEGTEIASAFRDACYGMDQERVEYFGLSGAQIDKVINKNKIMWAPDGDEAFDDSSYILQFDVGHRVRLIGMKCPSGHAFDRDSLRDVWLESDLFYGTLREWISWFDGEWANRSGRSG